MDPDLFDTLLAAALLLLGGLLTWLAKSVASYLKKTGTIQDDKAFNEKAAWVSAQVVRYVEQWGKRKRAELGGETVTPGVKLQHAVALVRERVPKLSVPDAEIAVEAAVADFKSQRPPPFVSVPPLSLPPGSWDVHTSTPPPPREPGTSAR